MKRCAALMAFGLLSALAGADNRPVFSIAPQPLARALNEFAEQSGMQLVYRSKLTAGIETAGAQGATPEDILDQLLAGTGLGYEYLNATTITLAPIPTSDAETNTMAETVDPGAGKPWFANLITLLASALLATAAGAAEEAEEAEDAANAERDVETLVVTGTRLARLPSELSSQVFVLSAAELRDTGEGTLEGALRRLPQNYGGGNESAPFITDVPYDRTAFNGTANVFGGSTINLRGVGERGTLVLVNGKRLAMSGLLGGYADISSIPLHQVDRVEIVTDGASAIYGGDAVGGVVNIVLRDDYDGVTANLRHDAPTGGGYRRLNASVAATLSWAHGQLSGAFTFRERTMHALADSPLRHFLDDSYRNYFTAEGTALGGHYQDAPIASLSALVGRDVSSASIPAGQDGTALTPADFVATADDPVTAGGGYSGYDLSPGRSDYTLRLALSQEFGGVSLASSVRYAPRSTTTRRSATRLTLRVPATSPFNPFGEAVRVLRVNELLPGPTEVRAENDSWNVDASLDGSFGGALSDWKWTADMRYARDRGTVLTTNDFAFHAIQRAVSDHSLNPFGASLAAANSPDLLAPFVIPTGDFDTLNEETGFSAHVTGRLFSLPAGEVRSVLGVDYRDSRLALSAFRDTRSSLILVGAGAGVGIFPGDTDRVSNAGLDFEGIEGAVRVEDAPSGLKASRAYRSAFAEMRIPVMANPAFLANRVEVNLAVRHEDAESYGAHETWSAGAVWEVNPALRLRISRGTSYSTPTLSQAAIPTTLTPSFIIDFTAPVFFVSVINVAGGNSVLRPEEANTLGGGVEFTPAFAPGLALSANYSRTDYTNRIDGTVGLLASILYNAGLDARFPNLYRRDGENNLLGVDARAVNIAEQSSAAVDFVADYERETAAGTFSVGANVAVTERFEQRLSPRDAESTDLLGQWIPKRRYDVRAAWKNRGLRIALGVNVTADLTRRSLDYLVTTEHPVLVDLNASYDFDGGLFGSPGRMLGATRLRLGIGNLGDKFIKRREVSAEDGSPNPDSRRRIPAQIASTGGRTYFVELVKTW